MLAVVILAAGESARMGSPKALLPFPSGADEGGRGNTFLEHLLEVTRHAQVGITRVVLGAHAAKIRESVKLRDEDVVVNADWRQGQLSSIQCALRSLRGLETTGMLLCPVDVPLVSARLVAGLIERFTATRSRIVNPTYKGKRGHPVIFPSGMYEELLAAPLEVGARAVVYAHAAEIEEVATEEEGVVLNLNNPEALRRVAREIEKGKTNHRNADPSLRSG